MKIEKVDSELSAILKKMANSEELIEAIVKPIHKDYKLSAKNLCRYLILRSFDLTKYHDPLSDLGISSLRTAEGYVFNNLYNAVKNLRLTQGISFNDLPKEVEIVGYKKSKKLITKHADELFNKPQRKHFTEIMVTLPNEAAYDEKIIKNMALQGMEIARINLSHGDIDIWTKMVTIIHKIKKELQQEIKIYMDLSGPKIRTSEIKVYSKKGKIRNYIRVKKGERILLTKRETFGKKSSFKKNEQLTKAEIGVLLPQIIDDVKIGDKVLFDDGMIKSKVVSKTQNDIELVITNCYKSKLASNKGINLPNTKLNLPALTERDIELLPFVCKHADIVGYSFVRTSDDVQYLYKQLKFNNAEDIGVVFKIENKEAFENLPYILLEGMQRNKIGVMIARGDLAVEIGFKRTAEVQNQILWFCEAAHVPVIWATQVLENLAKTGIPTRSEISDAAQGAYAECVMLNKGAYIDDAIRVLGNILIRMETHSFKKKDSLRALSTAKKSAKSLMYLTK